MSSSSDDEQYSTEDLNERVAKFVRKCGPWVLCECTLIQTNDCYNIQIILDENTLSKAYLYITKEKTDSDSKTPAEWALFSISRLITLHFDEIRIHFTFDDYNGESLLFINDPANYNNRHLELLVSQFRVCAMLSKVSIEDEKFRANNEIFLKKNASPNEFLRKMPDVFSIPCAASPICFDSLGARETWSKRNKELNASYFTRPIDFSVCCVTWNVGGGGNPNSDPKVLEDLRKFAKENHDLYFFAFQEIDMSFGAIVGGSSPMADEWTNCICKAFNLDNVSKKRSRRRRERLKAAKNESPKHPLVLSPTASKSNDDSLCTEMFHSKRSLLSEQHSRTRSGSFSSLHGFLEQDMKHDQKFSPTKGIPFLDQQLKPPDFGDTSLFSRNDIKYNIISDDDLSDSYSDPFVLKDEEDAKSAPELILQQKRYNNMALDNQQPIAISKPEITPTNNNQSQYMMKEALSLGGLYAAIVVRKSLPLSVQFDPHKRVRLGMHGMTANKSAIVFRSKIDQFTRINFVGCHLSAHQNNTEARNEELRTLLRSNTITSAVSKADKTRSIEKVDFLVLEGDLNYRIDLDYPTCLVHINNKNLQALLAKDQLNNVKKHDEELGQFDESPISFLPTYKYDKRSDTYDTSPKQRIPSYTDRVLVVTNNESNFQSTHSPLKPEFVFETDIIHDLFPNAPGLQSGQHYSSEIPPAEFPKKPEFTSYNRIENQFSDHRPVKCVLTFQIPKIIDEKYNEFENVQTRRLEEMAAVSTPKLEPKSAQFTIGLNKSVTFELTNVSCAWANWHVFVQPCEYSDEDEISISPTAGVIFPQQKVKITLTGNKKTKKKISAMKKALKYSRNIIIESSDSLPLAFIEANVSNKK